MTDKNAQALARALKKPARAPRLTWQGAVGGGPTARLDLDRTSFFVKRLPPSAADQLDAEADGLQRLAAIPAGRRASVLLVPVVHGVFEIEVDRWLVLEWFDLAPLSRAASYQLGRQLAEHHRGATAEFHGLERDNWIGATPQINTPTEDWTAFLFEHSKQQRQTTKDSCNNKATTKDSHELNACQHAVGCRQGIAALFRSTRLLRGLGEC